MHVLSTHFPKWKDSTVHESSPGWDIVSQRMARECKNYVASQYDTAIPFGDTTDTQLPCRRYRSEDLEKQTFPDEAFDIVFMQDVFEHVFHPDRAIKEIARTLKPGGALIMTVPIILKTRPSRRRARIDNGTVAHILPPDFHGNPVGDGASLVNIDWGYDIVRYLSVNSGMSFCLVQIDNIDLGIRADLIDVVIGFKSAVPDLS